MTEQDPTASPDRASNGIRPDGAPSGPESSRPSVGVRSLNS